jgi:hypothetical protein
MECKILQGEEYLRVVVPDKESFLKRHEARIMIGNDKDLWADGKKVEDNSAVSVSHE